MKLSVLIPMYNAATYIGNCIDSLINQDILKSDYEIIIMDDGSTDDSVKIVNSYQKKYNNIRFYQESNSGVDATRNKLLKLNKGDYIYFIDADDYIAYNSLGKMLYYAEKADLDIVVFNSIETHELNNYHTEKKLVSEDKIAVQNGFEFLSVNRHLRHEIWRYLIKKRFIDELQLTFDKSEYNRSGDVVFTLKLFLSANKIYHYPINIHRYVQTKNSLTRCNTRSKNIKLINSMSEMIINYSKLINSLKERDIKHEKSVMENLRFRRDVFVFFIVIKMIRNGLKAKELKEKLLSFEEVDAYPVKHFISEKYNGINYKMLVKLVNIKNFVLLWSGARFNFYFNLKKIY
jgi:glycosyltransferase involved in cell wall biosynthesis